MSATDFGLIGHPLGHSLSPFIHQSLLEAADLPGTYTLFDLEPNSLAATLPPLLARLGGLNCTIPFKETIIPFLDGLEPTAALIGAVNTVWQKRGYNTDLVAFQEDCPSLRDHCLLILGAGGVCRTMAFAAASAGAAVWILARRPEQAEKLAASVRKVWPESRIRCPADLAGWLADRHHPDYELLPWGLLNGTPLGLWPHTAGMPFPVQLLDRFAFVYDTIYNPVATRLVLAARSRGIRAENGLGMLFGQAVAAQRIWHPAAVFPADALALVKKRLKAVILEQFPLTIILNGYMGSGKSTVGQALAARMGLPFQDLDTAIEASAGQTIPDIFQSAGEPGFRRIELENLAVKLKDGRSKVLAVGGGALVDPAAETLVREAPALIVYLDTPLEVIRQRVGQGQGRPMIFQQGEERFVNLYSQRRPRYQALADLQVGGAAPAEQIAAKIAGCMGFEGGKP
jgi:shikimate dehydrogenase